MVVPLYHTVSVLAISPRKNAAENRLQIHILRSGGCRSGYATVNMNAFVSQMPPTFARACRATLVRIVLLIVQTSYTRSPRRTSYTPQNPQADRHTSTEPIIFCTVFAVPKLSMNPLRSTRNFTANVSTFTLNRLCEILDCQLSDIAEYKKP